MKFLSSIVLAVLAIILISCGGAGGVGSGGTGFSGTQLGAITGFGSVIVEGNTYSETGASYVLSKNPSVLTALTSDKVRIGMQVELSYSGSGTSAQAKTVTVKPTLIGTIESVAVDSMVVAGQRVRLLSAPAQVTVFENFATFASLIVGQSVEVHGTLNANDEILATRIELLSTSASGETRLSGRISAIQTLSSGIIRLSIGAMSVDITTLTTLSQAGSPASGTAASTITASALAVGQRVSVYASSAVSGVSVTATALQVEKSPSESTAPMRIGGIISALGSGSGRFSIGPVDLDASGAAFSGGTLADLATGKQVRASGTITTSASGGLLKATEVKFISTSDDVKLEVLGTISDFVSSGSFRIRNSVINASGAAVQFSGGTVSMLGNDVLVKVEGNLVGNQVVASKVIFQDSSDNRFRAFVGTVSNYSAGAGTFTIQGVNARLLANTSFTASNGGTASLTSVTNGIAATVRGSMVNNVFEVSEIEISLPSQPRLVKLKGGAYEIDLNARTLKINGQAVHWSSSTRIDGVLSNLALGYTLEVEGFSINNVVEADRMKITKP